VLLIELACLQGVFTGVRREMCSGALFLEEL
jgi:hypothetical protein